MIFMIESCLSPFRACTDEEHKAQRGVQIISGTLRRTHALKGTGTGFVAHMKALQSANQAV